MYSCAIVFVYLCVVVFSFVHAFTAVENIIMHIDFNHRYEIIYLKFFVM